MASGPVELLTSIWLHFCYTLVEGEIAFSESGFSLTYTCGSLHSPRKASFSLVCPISSLNSPCDVFKFSLSSFVHYHTNVTLSARCMPTKNYRLQIATTSPTSITQSLLPLLPGYRPSYYHSVLVSFRKPVNAFWII